MIVVPAGAVAVVVTQGGVKSVDGVERRRRAAVTRDHRSGNRLPILEPGMRWCGGYCMPCDRLFRTRKLSDAHSVACVGPMLHGVDMDLRGLDNN